MPDMRRGGTIATINCGMKSGLTPHVFWKVEENWLVRMKWGTFSMTISRIILNFNKLLNGSVSTAIWSLHVSNSRFNTWLCREYAKRCVKFLMGFLANHIASSSRFVQTLRAPRREGFALFRVKITKGPVYFYSRCLHTWTLSVQVIYS